MILHNIDSYLKNYECGDTDCIKNKMPAYPKISYTEVKRRFASISTLLIHLEQKNAEIIETAKINKIQQKCKITENFAIFKIYHLCRIIEC